MRICPASAKLLMLGLSFVIKTADQRMHVALAGSSGGVRAMGRFERVRFAGGLIAILILAALMARPARAQQDPSGEWSPRFDEDWEERIPGPEIGDYLGIPINAAARLRGDSWDAALVELPENQ